MTNNRMMSSILRFVRLSGAHSPDGLKLLGLLLTPVAVAAGTLAAWRFGVDAGWTSAFFIAGGFLSHWQVWCAFAVSAEVCAWSLGRGPAKLQPGVPALVRAEPLS
jgi:hypothetical protein